MTPQPSYRIVRAGWIMARAFTPHVALALLAFPWALMLILPGTLRRGLLLDAAGTGMVMLYRSRPWLDVLVMVAVMIPAFALVGAMTRVLLIPHLPGGGMAAVVGGLALLPLIGLAFLLPREGGSAYPFGPETPPGERWEIAGLAQLPGTRLTAIQLALRAIDRIPPSGAVVVATANSAELLRRFRQLGFTEGRKKRVYKVLG